MLNKYYGQTDKSIMYRIAMCTFHGLHLFQGTNILVYAVLHPCYKSSYFIKAKWPREWIDTAEWILRDQYEMYYKPNAVQPTVAQPVCAYYYIIKPSN